MNEHRNVNKDYKAPQRITWHILLSPPTHTNSFPLKYPVTVHIQSKVIICPYGKNKRAVLIPGLSPLLTWVSPRSPNQRLISKHWQCWWTMSMYVGPFLLFITKRSKFKELELTQKLMIWNIEWMNLDIRACNKTLVWAEFTQCHE